MEISSISPGNPALEYIDRRLRSDDYRGLHLSQHNRFNLTRVYTILTTLHKHIGSGMLLIRNTDLSKRPINTPEEAPYARFCDEVKSKIGTGTQDAMRKNYFVDFERMGLIERYDDNKYKNFNVWGTFAARYVKLSEAGIKLIEAPNIVDRSFIYSKGIDALLKGLPGILLEVIGDLRANENDDVRITADEYTLILSAIGDSSDISLSRIEAVKLVKAYRSLSATQRIAVISMVNQYATPQNFNGNKTAMRDYHNWLNESQQIFDLLGETVYFELRQTLSGIRVIHLAGPSVITPTELSRRLRRSLSQKHKYFENHKVNKRPGFELHHVVSLSSSESLHHFKILDNWQNMVYINAYEHSLITQNRNRNVRMSFQDSDMDLTDFQGYAIHFVYNETISYSLYQKETMLHYNTELNSYK